MYILKHKNIMSIISYTGIIGCLFSYVLYELGLSATLASLFIRRLLFIPAQLKFLYYDFVTKHDFLFFSEGLIGKIINTKSPYDMKFPNLISYVYFNEPQMSSNTGYLGSGYANFGFVGMLIYVLLFTFILISIDSIGKKTDNSLVTGITLFSILTLNDVDLLTTLLTGGLIFLMLLLYLYATANDNNVKIKSL